MKEVVPRRVVPRRRVVSAKSMVEVNPRRVDEEDWDGIVWVVGF